MPGAGVDVAAGADAGAGADDAAACAGAAPAGAAARALTWTAAARPVTSATTIAERNEAFMSFGSRLDGADSGTRRLVRSASLQIGEAGACGVAVLGSAAVEIGLELPAGFGRAAGSGQRPAEEEAQLLGVGSEREGRLVAGDRLVGPARLIVEDGQIAHHVGLARIDPLRLFQVANRLVGLLLPKRDECQAEEGAGVVRTRREDPPVVRGGLLHPAQPEQGVAADEAEVGAIAPGANLRVRERDQLLEPSSLIERAGPIQEA